MLPVTTLTREANNQPDGVIFWLLSLNGADTTDVNDLVPAAAAEEEEKEKERRRSRLF